MAISSFEAAKKICDLSGWITTNLSLQKILYFCHMNYLGSNSGKPLIQDGFQAWMYGPVLPALYEKLKIFGAAPVSNRFYGVGEIKEQCINACLERVGSALLKREAWELVTLTHHKNGAWAKNYTPGFSKNISNEDVLEEYQKYHG